MKIKYCIISKINAKTVYIRYKEVKLEIKLKLEHGKLHINIHPRSVKNMQNLVWINLYRKLIGLFVSEEC